MFLRRGRPMQGLPSWLSARRQRYGFATGIKRDCHITGATLWRQACVFLRRAASALRRLLGSSIGMASGPSRPFAAIHVVDSDGK